MSTRSNLQNIYHKKNIEVTTRKIFDIKKKTNDFNCIVLNELNGFQTIYYLKNKKIQQLFLKAKKKTRIRYSKKL